MAYLCRRVITGRGPGRRAGISGKISIGATPLVWSSALLGRERLLIEEILVTAQRIEGRAQSAPIALNARGETSLDDRRIIGLADLEIQVPGLDYATSNVGDMTIHVSAWIAAWRGRPATALFPALGIFRFLVVEA